MKLSITILLIALSSISAFSQPLSKTDFKQKMVSALNEMYNVSKVPGAFTNCAYSLYKQDYSENGETEAGFYTGVQVAQTCMVKYLDQIVFSDEGKKLRDVSLGYFEEACQANNKPYENQIYVNGYCSCLRKSYDRNNISLKTMINPNFVETEMYQNIAISCFDDNKMN